MTWSGLRGRGKIYYFRSRGRTSSSIDFRKIIVKFAATETAESFSRAFGKLSGQVTFQHLYSSSTRSSPRTSNNMAHIDFVTKLRMLRSPLATNTEENTAPN